MRKAASGVRRGNIELNLYDSSLGRLDHANASDGGGRETVRAVVDDDVYLRVQNTKDTRWPSTVNLGLDRSTASAGNVQTGGQPRPVLSESTPLPETYGASRSDPIGLLLGSPIAASSVNPRTVQLIDGETGEPLPRALSLSGQTLTVTPSAPLSATRTYSVLLTGLRSAGGRSLVDTRIGFRTGG